jgi:formylglycine-generating enzyme required for sulfatase activity
MDADKRRSKFLQTVTVAVICLAGGGVWGQGETKKLALPQGFAAKPGVESDADSGLPITILCARDGSEMVLVLGGEFTMGGAEQEPPRVSRAGRREPKPGARLRLHKVSLPPYYIDKFEITNAQFAVFMRAGGYQKQELWSPEGWDFVQGLSKPQPYAWENADFAGAQRPVAGASFFEAEAYARWARRHLPSEAEWEKAARGTDHRRYPWGNEPPTGPATRPPETRGANARHGFLVRCNFGLEGDGFRFTAPVGSFPLGRSPYGCEDMAGNVWEWCADWHDDTHPESSPPHGPTPEERQDCRPLRGGAWMSGEWDVDVDARHWLHRWYQTEAVGFRTALRIESHP